MRVPSPPPASTMAGNHYQPAAPQYDMRQPYPDPSSNSYMPHQPHHPPVGDEWSDDDDNEDDMVHNQDEIVMDWKDLPPEERPGYVPPGHHRPSQPGYTQAQHAEIKYAPALTPQFTNYAVAPQAQNVTRPEQPRRSYSDRSDGSFKYRSSGAHSSPDKKIKYTSKPIAHHSSISEGSHGSHGYQASPFPVNAPPLPIPPPMMPPPQGFPPYEGHGGLPYPPNHMPGMSDISGIPGMPGHMDYANIKEVAPRDSPPHKHRDSKSHKHRDSLHRDSRDSMSHDPRNSFSHLPPPPPLGPPHHSLGDSLGMPPMPGGFDRAPSPGLPGRMDRLSVNTNGAHVRAVSPGQAPPASPLLEAYRGTYQEMPSPLLMPRYDDDLDDLPPLTQYDSKRSTKSHRDRRSDSDSDSEKKSSRKHRSSVSSMTRPSTKSSKDSKSSKSVKIKSYSHTDEKPVREPSIREPTSSSRRVTMYDAQRDAKTISEALSHSRPQMQPLADILPTLSHDQLMELRAAYKKVIKIQGRGINIAKHIKLKTTGAFGKLAYVLALGRWESEGYWANYWYQSNSARRELLIEALMGRTNQEIKLIKADFQDKRYNDSLTRCMEKELKADKFRTAVLLALEERRQEEHDVWPMEYRNRDVDALYEALRRREGGETAILQIVVSRSDAHLREVLRTYERKYGSNFAREALKKSNNLVVSSRSGTRSFKDLSNLADSWLRVRLSHTS